MRCDRACSYERTGKEAVFRTCRHYGGDSGAYFKEENGHADGTARNRVKHWKGISAQDVVERRMSSRRIRRAASKLINQYAYGEIWGREALPRKIRSRWRWR